MNDSIFLDSNVLVYLYSADDLRKAEKASLAVARNRCFTGVNNINETITVLHRKHSKKGVELLGIAEEIDSMVDIVPVEYHSVANALRIMDRYGFSYYDSLVVALALENDCSTLYTEDLQHGQVIDEKLTVTDIFA